ncbi:MAG: zf-HC2 domain-containing protein [Ignavibacteriales bacterium]|nr:zf-HC2 domain-containing protein [Ignavibacteriales bacterium]
MKHKKIQKRFLLYIDGDLTETEKLLIEQHLTECSSCKKHFEELANIWNEEIKLEQPLPSPALWYALKNRMEEKTRNPGRVSITNAKLLLNTAFTVAVVVLAILTGSWFGSRLNPRTGVKNNSYVKTENIRDDFGMSYFDVVSPNSITKDIFLSASNDKGLQK